MKLAHGRISKQPAAISLYEEPSEKDTDDELREIIAASYQDWVANGKKRTWDQTSDAHIIAIPGNSLTEVTKRLRVIGKELGLSIRIGRPIASEKTQLFLPVLGLDKAEPKAQSESAPPVESYELTLDEWIMIKNALGFVAYHASDDHALAEINKLSAKIESILHGTASASNVPELES